MALRTLLTQPLTPWPLAIGAARLRADWRLLLVVTAVAVTSCTLVSSLALLVTATEQDGIRTAISGAPDQRTAIDVTVLQPTVSIETTRAASDAVIADALGDAGSAASEGIAVTDLLPAPALDGDVPALAYLGEFDAVTAHATLVDGAWPIASDTARGTVPVALPEAAATAFALRVGSTVTLGTGDAPVTVEVTGVYRAEDPDGSYWARDLLRGTGDDPAYPQPRTSVYVPTDAFGPLLVASGGLDVAALPVQLFDIAYRPDLTSIDVGDLAPLAERLDDASDDILLDVGTRATAAVYSTDLPELVDSAASSLIITRTTVVVVSLLLIVLALAALAQTSRLLVDSRAVERQLQRARGGSAGQIVALAVIEAATIGVVTAVLSPLLALGVFRLIAVQPAMVSAGVDAAATLPSLVWFVAASVALLFMAVLVAPVVRRTDPSGAETVGRARGGSGAMRSGIDLGLVVLAGVAYWQLQAYRTPVADATVGIDPVLVAGPALVLLAGALVCARLVPAAASVLERIGARSSGAVLPLASWEVGRRARRAGAAVLLLTLTLAVGTFSQSFLSTWRQSQVDQASVAVGAPVRFPSDESSVGSESALLEDGAVGDPQPAIRANASVAGPGADLTQDGVAVGANATVLALTDVARAMIDRGRLADEGGATIRSALAGEPDGNEGRVGVELPGEVGSVLVTARVGAPDAPLAGVSARLYAITEDASGLIGTVALGSVAVDGQTSTLAGALPGRPSGAGPAPELRFVGLQADVYVSEPESYAAASNSVPVDILLGDLAVLPPGDENESDAVTAPLDPGASWSTQSSVPFGDAPVASDVPDGWQLHLGVDVPPDIEARAASYTMFDWLPERTIPAVLSSDFATRINVQDGAALSLVFPDTVVSLTLEGTAPLVPGVSNAAILGDAAPSNSTADDVGVVVVDQVQLGRALAQAGRHPSPVDEWWIDVPTGAAADYVAAHEDLPGSARAVSIEQVTEQLQQGPLRVATQAALWLTIAAAGLLAIVGFAVRTAATLRSRRTEFAQLRAVGLPRRGVVAVIAAESVLLSVLGIVFGVAIGALLGLLVGPLVAVSPTGAPSVPDVVVLIPWADVALLVAAVIAAIVAVVLVVARAQRFLDPAQILRGGRE